VSQIEQLGFAEGPDGQLYSLYFRFGRAVVHGPTRMGPGEPTSPPEVHSEPAKDAKDALSKLTAWGNVRGWSLARLVGSSLKHGEFSIGDWMWGASRGSVEIIYSSTRMGTSMLLKLMWRRDKDPGGEPGPIDSFVRRMLDDISPEGPNAGKRWPWAEADQGIHYVREAVVKHVQFGYPPGMGCGKATIILSGPQPNILAEAEWLMQLIAVKLESV
jgi:hypothetical protein